jgi:hypothetical protein
MRKVVAGLALLGLLVLGTVSVLAEGYSWLDHALPFDFLFGNHIDTHQQSLVAEGDLLEGFFYIRLTGDSTADGVPIAKHADCNKVEDQCTVGWILNGIPIQAMYLGHESGSHPEWYIDPAYLPRRPGYTHFHWLGKPEHPSGTHEGTTDQTDGSKEGMSDHTGGLQEGQMYDGYLLKLTAVDTFFFEHHGGFLVTPGIDKVTHANIVTTLD